MSKSFDKFHVCHDEKFIMCCKRLTPINNEARFFIVQVESRGIPSRDDPGHCNMKTKDNRHFRGNTVEHLWIVRLWQTMYVTLLFFDRVWNVTTF